MVNSVDWRTRIAVEPQFYAQKRTRYGFEIRNEARSGIAEVTEDRLARTGYTEDLLPAEYNFDLSGYRIYGEVSYCENLAAHQPSTQFRSTPIIDEMLLWRRSILRAKFRHLCRPNHR